MLDVLFWWLTLLILGLAALPITLSLFRNLPDRGYAFSRPLGLLLFSYLFWLLGTMRILPNSRTGVFILFFLLVAISLLVLWRRRREVLDLLVRQRRAILVTELLFAGAFVFWAVIRSYTPAIAHTEQPMDFALMNGILRSSHFPPNDPWYAGESISYYYFGHLMAAGLTKLTDIASSVTYNLSLVSTAAMAATGAMSLVYNLVYTMRRPDGRGPTVGTALAFGVAGAVLLLFLGNLVGLLEFLAANDVGERGFWRWLWPWVGIDGLSAASYSPAWFPTGFLSIWRSTRVINTFVDGQGLDFTITEFPFFSFLLGDLHPHVMSLPFVLLALGLSYNVLRSPAPLALQWLRSRPLEVLMVVLLLGGLGFLNSWDLPTFTTLFLAAILLRAFQARAAGLDVSFRSVAALMLLIALGAVFFYIPFYVNIDVAQREIALLETQASGILPVRRAMTRPLHFLLIFGPFLLLNLSLMAALAWESFRGQGLRLWGRRRSEVRDPEAAPAPQAGGHLSLPPDRRRSIPVRVARLLRAPLFWVVALPLLPFIAWALIELGMTLAGSQELLFTHNSGALGEGLLSIGSRFWHLLPIFVILSLALALLFRDTQRGREGSAPIQFAQLLIVFAFFLILGTELFRISDLFGIRMNTVFKFYYQAWALLAVGGALGLYFWLARPAEGGRLRRLGHPFLLGSFFVVILAAFLYVPPAVYEKANRFQPSPTLDGLAQAVLADPDEAEAIQWLLRNARGAPVIVEAVAPGPTGLIDYDPAVSRISQRTGLPAVLGWPGHEHQWRGNPYGPIAERLRDVERIYRSPDTEEVRGLLDKYDVTYVIVGGLERRSYGVQVGDRFASFMDIAFQNSSVVIYTTAS